jgi:hypothetical protein
LPAGHDWDGSFRTAKAAMERKAKHHSAPYNGLVSAMLQKHFWTYRAAF